MSLSLSSLPQQKIDLVDFHDVQLLMPEDGLYRGSVSADRKKRNLTEYYHKVAKEGYPRSPVTPENVNQINTATYGLSVYLNHLWEVGVDFDILDVGSHIGDFSVKMGNVVRTFGKKCRVVAFEPTEVGAFINYNIVINGLESIVRHENLAVSTVNGLVMFEIDPGYSDGASACGGKPLSTRFVSKLWATLKNRRSLINMFKYPKDHYLRLRGKMTSYNQVARSVILSDYLDQNNMGNLFMKLDTEGLEIAIIDSLWPRFSKHLISIVTEFTPGGFEDNASAVAFLEKMNTEFVIYEIFYSPNPTRFDRLDPAKLAEFPEFVRKERPPQYTDLFLIPKRVPQLDRLLKRLDGLARTKDDYVL